MKTQDIFFREFLDFEDKYDLFHTLKENEVFSWHYIRFWIYTKLIYILFGLDNNNNKISRLTDENSFVEKMYDKITKSPYGLRSKDLLIFNHSRRVKNNNYYKCAYTDELLRYCDYSYYVFENAYNGIHYKPIRTKNIKYFDVEKYGNFIGIKKEEYSINVPSKNILNVLKLLEEEFKITLNNKDKKEIVEIYINQLRYREYYCKCYNHLLNIIKPKAILLVVAYNYQNMLIIETAKKMNIKTIELEHGIIANNHIAYSFKRKWDLPAFPDYIFTFGKYDSEYKLFPFHNKFAIPVGNAELEYKIEGYKSKIKSLRKKKKIITFISNTNPNLIKCAIHLRKLLDYDNYDIKIKLHPSEYVNWKSFYPELIDSNVEVCDGNKHNVYYYLVCSDYVVGVASTTLFEATLCNCNIIILKTEGFLRSLSLVDKGYARLASNEIELFEIITQSKKCRTTIENENYYFRNNSVDNFYYEIKKIIKG